MHNWCLWNTGRIWFDDYGFETGTNSNLDDSIHKLVISILFNNKIKIGWMNFIIKEENQSKSRSK